MINNFKISLCLQIQKITLPNLCLNDLSDILALPYLLIDNKNHIKEKMRSLYRIIYF